MENLDPANFLSVMLALSPLLQDLKCNKTDYSYSYSVIKMVRYLGKVDPENIPRYMTILTTLVPNPKDAEAIKKLLSIFLKQGSVAAAERLVEEVEELTSLFETESDLKDIFEHLARVPSGKRAGIVKAIVPLVKGFDRNVLNSIYTGQMVQNLGRVNSADIPLYIKALEGENFNRNSAEETQKALKKSLPRPHTAFFRYGAPLSNWFYWL